MKRLWVALVGFVTLAGMASAQAFVWPQKWTVAKPAEVKRGGTIREAVISDYRTFNPFITAEAGNVPSLLAGPIGLVRRDPTTGDWIPYMAESWTISQNKLEITFKIRRGMKWSDGKPITADDWITTWRIHTDKAVGSNSYDSFFLDGKPSPCAKLTTTPSASSTPRPMLRPLAWPASRLGRPTSLAPSTRRKEPRASRRCGP